MVNPDRQSSGMTLVELLGAMAVSVLVLAAAVSVYCTLAGSLRRLQENRHAPVCAAVEQLRQDLAQCAQIPSTNFPAFLLESVRQDTNLPALSSVAFSTGTLPSPDADFSSMDVTRIRYGVMPGAPDEAGKLVRESMSLWGSNALGQSVSNIVLGRVLVFEVSVLVESAWTNNWSSSGRMLLPRAVRFRLDWQTETSRESERMDVFIPAGNLVSGVSTNK
jgi:type II secretory pathway component PulJ